MIFAKVCFAFVLLNFVQCEECTLPRLEKELDPPAAEGNWFLTLHTHNGLDDAFRCQAATLKATEGGFSLKFTEALHPTPAPYNEFTRLRPSIYMPATNMGEQVDSYAMDMAWKRGIKREKFMKMAEEERDLDARPQLFITDYKSFFIGIVCGDKGKKFVWVETKNQHLTARDVLSIRNELIKLGLGWSEVKLQMTDCASLPEVDSTKIQ